MDNEEKIISERKNDIYNYGCEASNLIKINSIIKQTSDFYKNKIIENKLKFEKYFITNDKKLLKEILISDIIKLNSELKDINNKYKLENKNNELKNEELKNILQNNIFKYNEEKEKIKEDNFILSNENKYKEQISKILQNEKHNSYALEYFQEELRTNFNSDNEIILAILKKDLLDYQQKLLIHTRYHNNYSNQVISLDKVRNNLKNEINDYSSSIKSLPNNNILKSKDLLNNYFNLTKKKNMNDKMILNKEECYFSEFEKSDDNNSDLSISFNNDNIHLEFEKKIFVPKYVIKTDNNKVKERTLNFIPKLNLKQIEYNKTKIHISHETIKKKNQIKCINNKNLQIQIDEMKKKIIEIFQNNKKLKKIIKRFEKFYNKMNKKISIIENNKI